MSYSSKDSEYLPGVISVLENNGARVYIDKNDSQLPIKPNEDTGLILKNRIIACRKFVLFVTSNGSDSKWIPWELGIADGAISKGKIALFPSSEKSYEQSWSEQEYLGLYDRIIWGNFKDQKPEWLVYDHHSNTAEALGKWLNK